MEELPARIGGRYRPVRLLGAGGMGKVYEVEHVHTGQRLALKVLIAQPGASRERFKREARVTAKVRSDHIVVITDADIAPELGDVPFLVMELLDGADLERTASAKPPTSSEVIEWLRQVARGLDKAHQAGIVHRDLKPENLFLTHRDDGSPLVKILDFGVSKLTLEGEAMTRSDQFLGTPTYMAPEQADSAGQSITPRTDLFALGLIAFKLLVGHVYWKQGSLTQLLAQLLHEPMAPASSRGSPFGAAFDAWFGRACNRAPDERFASATEQVEALASALELPSVTAARTSEPPFSPAAQTLTSAQRIAVAPTLGASAADLPSSPRKLPSRARTLSLVVVATLGGFTLLIGLRRAGPDKADGGAALGTTETPGASLSPHAAEPMPDSAFANVEANPAVDAGASSAAAAHDASAAPPPPIAVRAPKLHAAPTARAADAGRAAPDPLQEQF